MTTKFYSNCRDMVATITSGSSLALFKNAISYVIGVDLLNSAVTNLHVITVPTVAEFVQPIVTAAPLQLLAYHIAVLRGCDVDKPRNLAKSVTVE